ncbi:ATP-binding protein [Aromatoleum sp.]|uniref:ATP-binding protein n=1 Tax=Aromatoleum sp. TaxID=2307007 RepID=UPI002FC6AD5C
MTAPHERTAFPQSDLDPASGQREALLRQLVSYRPDWDEIASLIVRDPALVFSILEASPLPGMRLASTLRTELIQRLQTLGADLLRAWLLASIHTLPPREREARDRAQLVAECALHLAHQTHYPYPDEAYLAGLWHRLDELPLVSGLHAGEGDRPEQLPLRAADGNLHRIEAAPDRLAARIAAQCGLIGPIVDALAFQPVLEEELAGAHPLVRLLGVAKALAGEGWQARLVRLAEISGLETETLLSLRTDVGFIVQPPADLPPSTNAGSFPVDLAPAPALRLADIAPARGGAANDIAVAALLAGAFSGDDADGAAARLAIATRLLCRQAPPLVVFANERGGLEPLAAVGEQAAIAQWYAELAQRLDDPTSMIALAARSGQPSLWFATLSAAGRSIHDRCVARWLGGDGIECLPLHRHGVAAVAVVAADERRPLAPAVRRQLVELCGAAARRVRAIHEQRAAQERVVSAVEARYREHARRLAHEARNPLTVIKGYLGLMRQRHPEATELAGNLDILHGEIDRVANLLQRAGEAPAAGPEADRCSVPELLHDLRGLYGDALFESRGIRFELRIAAGLGPVAVPGSALRQVLLNLFRNASEALQPGGRFAVTVPGQVLSNGMPCLEIRLIDNGPGLEPARLADLFTPRPSAKGPDHDGLGLSIVREIMQQWQGNILCRSQSGTGTSFQLLLPLATRQRDDTSQHNDKTY